MPPPAAPLLEVRGVSKGYPGVQALAEVDLVLGRGEVLAVVGENGAGKSTLMKVLAGIVRPDAGLVRIEGRVVDVAGPRAARALGVALIHQELDLAENLDVGANVFLGREPVRRGRIDRAEIRRRTAPVLRSVGADFGPDELVGRLSIGRQQLVEIAKALAQEARVLVMDEPTSSLSTREAERLFTVVRSLRARGTSTVYVSHRLGEVRALADRVTVLRDGRNAGELAGAAVEHDALVRLMVGRDLEAPTERSGVRGTEPVLVVAELATAARPDRRASFAVHPGEVVGLAGLVGAGRSELLRAIFGVEPAVAGTVRVGDRVLAPREPRDAIQAGVGLVPEDRKGAGLLLDWALAENASLVVLGRLARPRGILGRIDRRAEQALGERLREALAIRVAPRQPIGLCSGGNQQKVVLAKWLALEPRVLLLDEPTRGIDVGARQEIYRLIGELAGRGVAVLFASSEMEEVLQLADRVLVMHEGRIAGELARAELGEEAVMRLATGGAGAAA